MELKEGYKRTELGLLPVDWDLVNLGDKSSKVGSGITPTGGERVYKVEGHPFLRSQNVGWGCLLMDDIAFIDNKTHGSFDSTEIEQGDVFLNITGASIGRSAVADERVVGGNVNQHVCIIRPNHEQLNHRFLNYFLLSRSGQRQIESFQAGGNRQGLNFGQIRSFLLPLPPATEQRAIAAALSDVDALIAALDRLIAKKRDIKQAAMQELLTGKRRLPGFSGEWQHLHFGDVLRVRHGKSQKDVVVNDGDYPILATSGEIGRTNSYLHNKPSVLIGRKGTIDEPQFVDTPFWTIDTLFFTEISNLASPRFIFYKFKMIDWYSHNEASGVPSLNASTVESIGFQCPPLSEQEAIASVLSDMDAEIAALQARSDKTLAMKQGMMQELLTGRIRLVKGAEA